MLRNFRKRRINGQVNNKNFELYNYQIRMKTEVTSYYLAYDQEEAIRQAKRELNNALSNSDFTVDELYVIEVTEEA